MEKPTNFHLAVILLKVLGKKHEMVIMAPDNIAVLIMFIDHICKYFVGSLICIKLGLETTGCGKTIFLWKAKIMKKCPQDVVTVAIVILMNNLFIKKNWYTSLQYKTILVRCITSAAT